MSLSSSNPRSFIFSLQAASVAGLAWRQPTRRIQRVILKLCSILRLMRPGLLLPCENVQRIDRCWLVVPSLAFMLIYRVQMTRLSGHVKVCSCRNIVSFLLIMRHSFLTAWWKPKDKNTNGQDCPFWWWLWTKFVHIWTRIHLNLCLQNIISKMLF